MSSRFSAAVRSVAIAPAPLLLKGLAVATPGGHNLQDPAFPDPGSSDVLRRLPGPHHPGDAAKTDLVIRYRERNLALNLELSSVMEPQSVFWLV